MSSTGDALNNVIGGRDNKPFFTLSILFRHFTIRGLQAAEDTMFI
jgi:hypothetical protein